VSTLAGKSKMVLNMTRKLRICQKLRSPKPKLS
jgi:hypothetical protein